MNKNIPILLCILAIACVFLYASKNMDTIMAMRAEYYFKKNDMVNAQKYYEKAFDYGLKETKARNIYVNSIINSPMNIDEQEKLVKFTKYPVPDSARTKAEYFLYDLRREVNKKYPNNYIQYATFNTKIVRWGTSPITYMFENSNLVPHYYENEIENAFSEWSIATNHKLLFEKTNHNPNIIISFTNNNYIEKPAQKYVIAYTNPAITSSVFRNAQITFYINDIDGKAFTANQIYNTALHEIVHALGFTGHSNDNKNIMYMTRDKSLAENDRKAELSMADINTINLLYDIKPDISNIPNATGKYAPHVVLGDEDDIAYAKAKEAKDYVRKAPNVSAGHIDMAESYMNKKDYMNTIKSLERALDVAQNEEVESIIYYNLAITYLEINHTSMAMEYVQKAQQIQDSEDLHYLTARIYSQAKNNKAAIKEYNYLINENPHNIEYAIGLTNIYVQNNNYFKARAVLKNFFAKNPKERQNPRLKPYGIIKLFL